MATESIGQTVHLTNEMADRVIEAMERVKTDPPQPCTREIKWGDSKEYCAKLAEDLKKQYGYEK